MCILTLHLKKMSLILNWSTPRPPGRPCFSRPSCRQSLAYNVSRSQPERPTAGGPSLARDTGMGPVRAAAAAAGQGSRPAWHWQSHSSSRPGPRLPVLSCDSAPVIRLVLAVAGRSQPRGLAPGPGGGLREPVTEPSGLADSVPDLCACFIPPNLHVYSLGSQVLCEDALHVYPGPTSNLVTLENLKP